MSKLVIFVIYINIQLILINIVNWENIGKNMELVKFMAVGSKKNILDYEVYSETILKNLKKENLIDKYLLNPDRFHQNVILSKNYTEKYCIKIIFTFNTFKDIKQLIIDISSDNYVVDVNEYYIETLKLNIKKSIVKDWKKIVWLYDEDASLLSIRLYSRFFVIENKFRRFINEFMLKKLGADWWDFISNSKVKGNYDSRYVGYKKAVPGFNNIDDHLLSIDVGDLIKILNTKIKKWKPSFDRDIENLLINDPIGKAQTIVNKLEKQLIIEEDFWQNYFNDYFCKDFSRLFDKFEKYRNHIAHNKFLDRNSYSNINECLDKVDKCLENALTKLLNKIKSIEQVQAEEDVNEELLLTLWDLNQTDFGILIQSNNDIVSEFMNAIDEQYIKIVDTLKIRKDIKITKLKFDVNNYSGQLFSVTLNFTKKRLDFFYSMNINDAEGEESSLRITCEQSPANIDAFGEVNGFLVQITYINGATEYDDEQGLFLPVTRSGMSEIDNKNCVSKIVEFINSELKKD